MTNFKDAAWARWGFEALSLPVDLSHAIKLCCLTEKGARQIDHRRLHSHALFWSCAWPSAVVQVLRSLAAAAVNLHEWVT